MASFKKLSTGWQFRVSFNDSSGKRHTKSQNGFATKKEAQISAHQLEQQLSKGNSITAGEAIFIDYFQTWYNVFRKGKHSWRNDRDIEMSIKVASTFFKQIKIKQIDRLMYQNFINAYAENHATATVQKIHTYVKACLRDALADGVIHKDPTYRVKVIGNKMKKDENIKFLNELEAQKLVTEARKNLTPSRISRYMILFGIATGCRFSEVLGLTWDCVDFKNSKITIDKSWDYQKNHDFSPTKNAGSVRTISVDKNTLSLLQELKHHQTKTQLKTGLRNLKNLVFIDKNISLNSNNAVNKSLHKICAKLNIKIISFHALRHTHASLLLYRNINIKFISRRLGHTEIITTLQTYSHILDELEQRESSNVDELFNQFYL